MNHRPFIIILLIIYSCTPDQCPELTMRKPNFYGEQYLTYTNEINQNGKYILFTGRCSTYELDILSSVRQYKEGYDHGKWKFYYKNGKIETVGEFDMGKRVNGWKYFYENGNLKQYSNYVDGKKSGLWFSLDIKGDTIWTRKYENDKIID